MGSAPSHAVELAQRLIRCPSVTPHEGGALDLLESELTALGFACTRLPFGEGAERIDLKRLLRELEAEGHLQKRAKTYRDPDKLPPVSMLEGSGITPDGDVLARALEWQGEGEPPRILFIAKKGDPGLAKGDRILCRMTEETGEDYDYTARLIRRIGQNARTILGIYRKGHEGGRITPIDKGADKEWIVPAGAEDGAKDGELVEAQQVGPKGRLGLPKARIVARLGDPSAARAVSLIAIHQHDETRWPHGPRGSASPAPCHHRPP